MIASNVSLGEGFVRKQEQGSKRPIERVNEANRKVWGKRKENSKAWMVLGVLKLKIRRWMVE